MPSKLDSYRASVFGNDPNILSNNEQQNAAFQEYLRSQRIRASLSRRDLQQHTDVKFFISSNFANLFSFITVLAVSFCLGWMGWGRDVQGNYKEISDRYETLLTPVFWIIPSTWGAVFFTEAIFMLCSFMKSFSHLPIVQKGVGFLFFCINCCQIGWIVSYCMGAVWLATLFMANNVIFLIWLNFNLHFQEYMNRAPQSDLEMNNERIQSMPIFYEWLLFRLPFQFHLGWGIFVLLLNCNETSIQLNWSGSPQIALVSVIVLWVIGIFVLFYPKSPIFVIPLVISWSAVGVWINLRDPSESLLQTFGPTTTSRMFGGIVTTCLEHAIIALIRFVFFFASSYSLLEKR